MALAREGHVTGVVSTASVTGIKPPDVDHVLDAWRMRWDPLVMVGDNLQRLERERFHRGGVKNRPALTDEQPGVSLKGFARGSQRVGGRPAVSRAITFWRF